MDMDRGNDPVETGQTLVAPTDRREMLKRFGALALGGLAFVAATRATGADDDGGGGDDDGGGGDDDGGGGGGRGGRRRRRGRGRRGGRGGDND